MTETDRDRTNATDAQSHDALDEDLAVQGTDPNDEQDAAVALGTAPPESGRKPFVGGGEVDWAELGGATADPDAED